MSSNLIQGTSYVGGARWSGTGLQIHGSRFDSCHLLQDIFVLQKFLKYNKCKLVGNLLGSSIG
jgi:hypothetical protein